MRNKYLVFVKEELPRETVCHHVPNRVRDHVQRLRSLAHQKEKQSSHDLEEFKLSIRINGISTACRGNQEQE